MIIKIIAINSGMTEKFISVVIILYDNAICKEDKNKERHLRH